MDEWGGVGTSVIPETDWEDVLLAYLHDPFDKALAVQGHETRAARYASAALGRDVSRRGLHRPAASADVVAAIAERVPSPTAGGNGERAVGPADGLGIVHPASDAHAALSLTSLDPDEAAAVIEELVRGLSGPRERFLAIWRRLPDAVAADFGDDAARLPAIHHGGMIEAGSEVGPGSPVSGMPEDARRPPSPSVHGGGCRAMPGGEGRR